ncbi:MAG: hypothetical protein O2820_26705, partial [Planctomycetota bacterium]|nr:hypothetical protein [Planctomycetota bacterium]
GLDIAQTDHTFSGLEIALWDLLGKRERQPVYRLLGYDQAFAKTPLPTSLCRESLCRESLCRESLCRESLCRDNLEADRLAENTHR